MKIIPTIFAHNKKEFEQRFNKLISIAKEFQIDFMDGLFVKSKSTSLKNVPFLPNTKEFEAHLMYNRPLTHLKKLKQKGFNKIIFHVESKSKTSETIKEIKKLNMSAWLALNPETAIGQIEPYFKDIDGVLFLGVHPGKEHQKFIARVYKKISALKKISPKTKIQVDGGINPKVAKKLSALKVDAINVGSFIADSKNPKEAFAKLLISTRH